MWPELDSEGRELLRAHDLLLRGEPELAKAEDVAKVGPLWLGRFGWRGFITYHDLGGYTGSRLDALISAALRQLEQWGVRSAEWKTRGHDQPGDLDGRLRRAGLIPDDVETVMMGTPDLLTAALPLPAEMELRQAGQGANSLTDDIAAIGGLHAAVFARHDPDQDQELVNALTEDPASLQLWLVQIDDAVVCAGRVELRGPTAGLFGGATDPAWRGRGLYRAVTTARAESAVAAGCELIYAECTPFSRPILERSGLRAITTTTPYQWDINAESQPGKRAKPRKPSPEKSRSSVKPSDS